MSNKPTHHFLYFTRAEKNGIVAWLVTMLILLSIPYVYDRFWPDRYPVYADVTAAMDILEEATPDSSYAKRFIPGNRERRAYENRSEENRSMGTLFYFDPNTLSADGWRKLGVRDKTIETIQRYISKGGRFRQANDLEKIWGLRPQEKEALIPYVRIEAEPIPRKPAFEPKAFERKSGKASDPIDINQSDSLAWVSLPGIGAGFARRISLFKTKLGGFYSVEQVAETYGLPDSVFQRIRPLLRVSGPVRKININTADENELKAHPYIRYRLAGAIVQYRQQHGSFQKTEDLKKIMILPDSTYTRLLPYLSVE
jgi:competence ComEA-like helix-hairpin-helix protein